MKKMKKVYRGKINEELSKTVFVIPVCLNW